MKQSKLTSFSPLLGISAGLATGLILSLGWMHSSAMASFFEGLFSKYLSIQYFTTFTTTVLSLNIALIVGLCVGLISKFAGFISDKVNSLGQDPEQSEDRKSVRPRCIEKYRGKEPVTIGETMYFPVKKDQLASFLQNSRA